ncbi:MAG: adenosylcobinamide-GDP ribazoletransferase [Mangrovibacterium sp.]
MIKRELNILLSSFLFFTRLHFPFKVEYRPENQSLILTWFPLVGLVVGAIGAMGYTLSAYAFPHFVSIILSVALMILSTGALHEDGWADVCDAFGGGYNKEQKLRIMKDSCVGAYAVIGLIMLFALKIFTLASIEPARLPLVLVAAHALSRWSVLLLPKFWHNARSENSKSLDSSSALSWRRIIFALAIASLPLFFFSWTSFLAIPLIAASSLLTGIYFAHHIDGYTGDCLGVVQQLNEVLLLLLALGGANYLP